MGFRALSSWDEFTEFFTGNVNVPMTPIAELACYIDMPFYLFLITHRALNQFTGIDDARRNQLIVSTTASWR